MRLDGWHFQFQGNRVIFPGLDWGYGDTRPYVVDRSTHFVVLRIRGRQNWDGNYSPPIYSPAEWYLLRYEWVPDRKQYRVVEETDHAEPGGAWRKCKARFLAKILKLEKKLS